MAKNFRNLQNELEAKPGAAQRAVEHRTKTLAQLGLHQLRVERDVTQAQLAELIDINQPGISRIEHADDVRVSTLRDYLGGLGAELRLEAVFHDGTTYPITLSTQPQTPKRRPVPA